VPQLEAYKKELDYSYAPGLYPSRVCIEKRPDLARRLLLSKEASGEGVDTLIRLAEEKRVRVEYADNVLKKLGKEIGKENIYAACVFEKPRDEPGESRNHIMLVNPSDAGNVGTIMRSMAGFGFRDLRIITPAADCFHPNTVRASMGAVFHLRVSLSHEFTGTSDCRSYYPFMLIDGAATLSSVEEAAEPYTLIFGNEGAGLPQTFANIGTPLIIEQSRDIDSLNLSVAASVAMYHFSLLKE
jgi:TrmH family RNA methyltransferase